ncbi:cytochrome P450 family protein [Nocardia takedensis]|uniref:cytochrome P450 family protein n=1 Tax=Nocardia takedensis TaxID=259390 RepID=UPI003F7684E9
MTDPRPTIPHVLDPTGTDIIGEAITLRERGPLVPVTLPGDIPAWAITEADLLRKLFTDDRVSKDAYRHWPRFIDGNIPEDWPLMTWVAVRNMFTATGQDHHRLRRLVSPAFTPRRIAALRSRIEQITDELLDSLAAHPAGTVIDLREHYAAQVPLRVITTLMGVPEDLLPRLRACVNELFATVPDRHPQETFTELVTLLTSLVTRRRTEPGEDMTSLLISHTDDEDRLTEQELVHTLLLVISAGIETTINLLDQAIHQLLTRPDLAARLEKSEFAWSDLIEETLRWAPPVANLPMRFAIADIDIDGHQIASGDAILAAIVAANRDPHTHGADPDTFDPARPGKAAHLAFGHGPHYCLGATLARLEAAVALPALFARFPGLTLATTPAGLTTLNSFISHGHQTLPAYLTAPPHPTSVM